MATKLRIPSTPLMKAAETLISQLEAKISPRFKGTVQMHIVGGIAVHAHTQSRMSYDFDATTSHQILSGNTSLAVKFSEEGGRDSYLRMDTNFFDGLGLFHPDWKEDSLPIGQVGRMQVFLISPVDLAVSKLARFQVNDKRDITSLAEAGLLTSDGLRLRAEEALDYFVGDPTALMMNIDEALQMVRVAEFRHKLGDMAELPEPEAPPSSDEAMAAKPQR